MFASLYLTSYAIYIWGDFFLCNSLFSNLNDYMFLSSHGRSQILAGLGPNPTYIKFSVIFPLISVVLDTILNRFDIGFSKVPK